MFKGNFYVSFLCVQIAATQARAQGEKLLPLKMDEKYKRQRYREKCEKLILLLFKKLCLKM